MIKSNKMLNPFIIAAQALVPVPHSTSLAPRHCPNPKPLADRRLHHLQLAYTIPITTTTEGLLAQFKYNTPAELDSDSDSRDICRRSYTREQKLAAIGYSISKRVWDLKTEQMVLISHKQACRDLGIDPVYLYR
jgi:hypothetical protein